ncbi:DUF4214 domain-containing protein [Paenibacillus alkalitolerans]|uniref:DUF4214 domain-containing protein n=1 Tax=Paenibacillus alkalitolerans TaxID=2799335 RepID=UPI0018F3CD9E|nr:DUF4214 domain-containing protein [Paenibacillus alkalitolerans]
MTLRIMELLKSSYHRPIPYFVWDIYNLLLDRRPDSGGYLNFSRLMHDGKLSKQAFICEVLKSDEFRQKYLVKSTNNMKQGSCSAMIFALLQLSGEHYCRELYRQILLREPSAEEVANHLNFLKSGTTRLAMLTIFVGSEEARRLLDQARFSYDERL